MCTRERNEPPVVSHGVDPICDVALSATVDRPGTHTQLNPADRVPRPRTTGIRLPRSLKALKDADPEITSSSRRRSSVRCEHTRRPDYPARRHTRANLFPPSPLFPASHLPAPPISPNTAAASSSSRPRTHLRARDGGSGLVLTAAWRVSGARYYGGNENIDKVEILCQDRALAAYRLDKSKWGVNVQPYSVPPPHGRVHRAPQPPRQDHGPTFPRAATTHGYYTANGKKISATSIF